MKHEMRILLVNSSDRELLSVSKWHKTSAEDPMIAMINGYRQKGKPTKTTFSQSKFKVWEFKKFSEELC